MNRLERRIERLERGVHVVADIERGRAVFHAYDVVRNHPEQATDEQRALAAATSHDDWQRAFATLIDAAGG
jgi:hypothetical protein